MQIRWVGVTVKANRAFPIIIPIIATFIALTLSPHASAATVYTAEADGTPTDTFLMGNKIRIIAYGIAPYRVNLTDPSGVNRYSAVSYTVKFDKVLSGYTDRPGRWTVEITERPMAQPQDAKITMPSSTSKTYIEYMTIVPNAIPEAPLGTLAISMTLFMALALGIFYKRPSRTVSP